MADIPVGPSARRLQTRRPRLYARVARALRPLLWIGPSLALIGLVVLLPVFFMVYSAFRNVDIVGFDHGFAGWSDFDRLFAEPGLGSVVLRTLVWVVVVVGVTMLISFALAQLFHQCFPGRRVARWALIAPWASSVFMTAVIFRWMLNPNSGLINVFLHDLGVVGQLGSAQADWLGRSCAAFWWMVVVAVFVSLPFTTYALLAGLETIPGSVYEAARVDGASTLRAYTSITLPLLRPALLVAALINIMNVFNNFPIIWAMTGGGPGNETATTTVFMYQIKASSIPESAALSVLNFGIVIALVLLFLRLSRWKARVD